MFANYFAPPDRPELSKKIAKREEQSRTENDENVPRDEIVDVRLEDHHGHEPAARRRGTQVDECRN